MPAIDWDLAAKVGATVARKGPSVRRRERAATVADLRRLSDEAHGLAVRVTALPDPGAPIATQVIGRGRWVDLTVETVQLLLASVGGKLRPREEWTLAETVRARALGAQVGAVLGWISGKIVGQFDPYGDPSQMLMIAPNVLQIERDLHVAPRDFRLWVLVHEHTHRLQFHAAPWLRDHLLGLMGDALGESFGPREASRSTRPATLADLLSHPGQRAVVDRVTAIMSVLEGYAEVMMDRVGSQTIPTVESIRTSFQRRREGGGVDAVVRKVLGMDTKMAQYREGAQFCRGVIDAVGVDGLNRVFGSAEAMPTYDELTQPGRWLDRVHPGR